MDLESMLSHLDGVVVAKTIVQLFIIVYAVLWVWSRIVGTQAERLVKGVIILSVIFLASYFAGFTIITSLLQHLIPVAAMAMVVVFQPEIRRGLGYLGRVKTLRTDLSLADSEQEKLRRDIEQIIAAVKELSRSKTGALIVIEPPEGERDYVSPGTPVNASISMNLLLTIFFHKSPLHDGAVVIRNDRIVAAGVILPMTSNPKLSYRYGTRHRAAIGLSEIYDGLCIVVSEETGSISAASRGMLVRYQNADELADPIEYLYHTPDQGAKSVTPWQSFLNMFNKKGNESTQDLTELHHFTDTLPTVPESLVKSTDHAKSVTTTDATTEQKSDVKSAAKSDLKAELVAELKTESNAEPLALDDPSVLGETQAPRKGVSDIDTLPPANDLKKGTVVSGKERRTPKPERRTTDLPGIEPMSLEEPEGVH
jgi:diadenylate cyclase